MTKRSDSGTVRPASEIAELDIIDDSEVGAGGFLTIRRVRLRNRRADGSLSREYLCDFATRPIGVDAVAVVIYRRAPTATEVLLRACLRPAVSLGRRHEAVPVAGEEMSLMLWEVVAGIIERGDEGAAGIARRAVAEVWEEAGYRVNPADIVSLGAPFFASPGSLCEQVYAVCVEVSPDAVQAGLEGDGSPMEEGATTRWTPLSEAIAECEVGAIRDLKTEALLRRLQSRLAGSD